MLMAHGNRSPMRIFASSNGMQPARRREKRGAHAAGGEVAGGTGGLDLPASALAPLPPEWQEWTEGNLGKSVPRWTVVRILEENRFGPNQIRSA